MNEATTKVGRTVFATESDANPGRFFTTLEIDGKKFKINVYTTRKDGTALVAKSGRRQLSLFIVEDTDMEIKDTMTTTEGVSLLNG